MQHAKQAGATTSSWKVILKSFSFSLSSFLLGHQTTRIAEMSTLKRSLDEAEDADARLILMLQLQDIEQQDTSAEENTTASSGCLAYKLYRDELVQYCAIRHFEVQEARLAQPLVSAAIGTDASHSDVQSAFVDLTLDDDTTVPAESAKEIALFECVSCADRFPIESIWQAPCQHRYCADCLEDLFRLAITDETLYPPRCCKQVMPFADVKLEIPATFAAEFEAAIERLEDKRPSFCHDPTCSTYIGAARKTSHVGTCPRCSKATCTICKAPAHGGDCPEDECTQQLLALAGTEGWKQCRNCHRVIELTLGCYHIT